MSGTDELIKHYKQTNVMSPFNCVPQTPLFFSSAPISLSIYLCSGELHSYDFKSSRLTLLMQSEPLHGQKKLQYTIISPFITLGLAHSCNTYKYSLPEWKVLSYGARCY